MHLAHRKPVDPRSTGRKRGRKVLFRTGRPYCCANCSKSPVRLPPDAPREIDWPKSNRVLESALQVQHINKNVLDNDPANLKWLCPSCHKLEDSQTEKGVSLIQDEFGYGLDFLIGGDETSDEEAEPTSSDSPLDWATIEWDA